MPAHALRQVPVVGIDAVALYDAVLVDVCAKTGECLSERLLELVAVMDKAHKAFHTLKLGAIVGTVGLVRVGLNRTDVADNLVVLDTEDNILEIRAGLVRGNLSAQTLQDVIEGIKDVLIMTDSIGYLNDTVILITVVKDDEVRYDFVPFLESREAEEVAEYGSDGGISAERAVLEKRLEHLFHPGGLELFDIGRNEACELAAKAVLLHIRLASLAAEYLARAHLSEEREMQAGLLVGRLGQVEIENYLVGLPVVAEPVFELKPRPVKGEEAIAFPPLHIFVFRELNAHRVKDEEDVELRLPFEVFVYPVLKHIYLIFARTSPKRA